MAATGFDPDGWLREHLGVLNEDGGRGYDRGVRIINCPFCYYKEGVAWVNIYYLRMQCFYPPCQIHTGINLVEAVRQLQGFITWTEALMWLRHEYPRLGPPPVPPKPPARYTDWVKWPPFSTPLEPSGILAAEALLFIKNQWGLSQSDAKRWGLRFCTKGRHAWRVLIPICLYGQPVAFTARTYRNHPTRYLGSAYESECGRPGEALLFNLDAVREGSDVILVEGPGDVMRWETQSRGRSGDVGYKSGLPGAVGSPIRRLSAVALLGTVCTEEKAALLAAKKPRCVTVALDNDVPSRECLTIVESLLAWGLPAVPGEWINGKDAGAGGTLVQSGRQGMAAVVAHRLKAFLTR